MRGKNMTECEQLSLEQIKFIFEQLPVPKDGFR